MHLDYWKKLYALIKAGLLINAYNNLIIKMLLCLCVRSNRQKLLISLIVIREIFKLRNLESKKISWI